MNSWSSDGMSISQYVNFKTFLALLRAVIAWTHAAQRRIAALPPLIALERLAARWHIRLGPRTVAAWLLAAMLTVVATACVWALNASGTSAALHKAATRVVEAFGTLADVPLQIVGRMDCRRDLLLTCRRSPDLFHAALEELRYLPPPALDFFFGKPPFPRLFPAPPAPRWHLPYVSDGRTCRRYVSALAFDTGEPDPSDDPLWQKKPAPHDPSGPPGFGYDQVEMLHGLGRSRFRNGGDRYASHPQALVAIGGMLALIAADRARLATLGDRAREQDLILFEADREAQPSVAEQIVGRFNFDLIFGQPAEPRTATQIAIAAAEAQLAKSGAERALRLSAGGELFAYAHFDPEMARALLVSPPLDLYVPENAPQSIVITRALTSADGSIPRAAVLRGIQDAALEAARVELSRRVREESGQIMILRRNLFLRFGSSLTAALDWYPATGLLQSDWVARTIHDLGVRLPDLIACVPHDRTDAWITGLTRRVGITAPSAVDTLSLLPWAVWLPVNIALAPLEVARDVWRIDRLAALLLAGLWLGMASYGVRAAWAELPRIDERLGGIATAIGMATLLTLVFILLGIAIHQWVAWLFGKAAAALTAPIVTTTLLFNSKIETAMAAAGRLPVRLLRRQA